MDVAADGGGAAAGLGGERRGKQRQDHERQEATDGKETHGVPFCDVVGADMEVHRQNIKGT